MTYRTRRAAGFAIGVTAIIASNALPAQDLLAPTEVLRRIEGSVGAEEQGQAPRAPVAALRADIESYRARVSSLPPAAAAARWFELYERTVHVDVSQASADYDAYDRMTGRLIGPDSLFSSLPPPSAWSDLRKLVSESAIRAPDRETLGLKFLVEVLTGDRKAAEHTLQSLDAVFAGLEPGQRDIAKVSLTQARGALIGMYGTPQEIAQGFERRIADGAYESYEFVPVPDLVGLVGADEARRLLERAIVSKATLQTPDGDATRKLARDVALANIERMPVAQWSLAESIDSSRLFEAMEKRFDPSAGQQPPEGEPMRDSDDYRKQVAATWYFLASVIDGRQTDAERALSAIAADRQIYVPATAVDALRRAGQGDALYRFLGAQLEHRPQVPAWDIYIREASELGHAKDSLALIDRLLARKDLPEFLVADLRIRRLSALLAADRVTEATAGFRDLLARAPARGEATLDARFDAALLATNVGRLTRQRDLSDRGFRFALAALPLFPRTERGDSLAQREQKLWRALRLSGRAADVQPLAIDELSRVGTRSGFNQLGGSTTAVEYQALVELVGIWSEAGRHADVLRLANESTRWGIGEAGRLLAVQDSVEVPFGVMLARALEATGDKASAARVALATISQLPMRDGAYELYARLDENAPATFDGLFARDPFEERPLIWKASVLAQRGSLEEAEATIRRAISIDPSDGEEGANDRMRAYSVLADLLKRKGDVNGATTYQKAVTAIRMSEHADRLHEAGLFERAFKEYRDALDQFSDAYCIQSRLAVQLSRQGRRAEALEHYRRAYELMPDSFGRVESHCFGCESVFQGDEAQSLAERVFDEAIRKTPGKAQNYYLLAYLREQQDRSADALAPLRRAVSIDPQYLNAWKHIDKVAEHTYVEPWEVDLVRLKLLELDPLGRHVSYSLEGVGDLAALWRGAEQAEAKAASAKPVRAGVYELAASAATIRKAREALPPEMREQLAYFDALTERSESLHLPKSPPQTLAEHKLVTSARALIGGNPERMY